MLDNVRSISDAQVKGKKVFVRCDFDVPLTSTGQIEDDTRLVSSVSTIEYLLEQGSFVVAAGHLGRPTEETKNKLSLHPVAKWFGQQFETEIEEATVEGFGGWKIKEDFVILENLRFYAGEEDNDPGFARKLANTAQIFVNEAFGSSHRAHASLVGVPLLLPHFAGFHFIREIKILDSVLKNPLRPLTFIVGGAKIETKLPLISKMHSFADFVLVGGELAENTRVLTLEEHRRIRGQKAELIVASLSPDNSDITSDSVDEFRKVISQSGMIIWNGPMGIVEKRHKKSSLEIAKAITKSSAYKIVGGGDTVAFLKKENQIDGFDFVSTGGGAMLEYLSGISLPGIGALV